MVFSERLNKIWFWFKNPVFIVSAIILLNLFAGCDEDDTHAFSADFDYEFMDENHVVFNNLSDGEYYSLMWDFGNGQKDTTTDKSREYLVYYPLAGDYNVSLTVLNYSGKTKNVVKTVNISKTDLEVSFDVEIDAARPNYVNLTNTTVGGYDSLKWLYRGKTVRNDEQFTAYFPYTGSYEIELQVSRNSLTVSEKKSVTISQDDPDYISGFKLVWSDEFDEPEINPENWTFETGAGGWGNNELQNYTNGQNAEISNGRLVITARKVNENKVPGSYTSSRIITKGKKEFTYGRMEIRAKLPSGTGIWPAIWMLGSNFDSDGWPSCGEIDIMEYVGYQPDIVHSTVHTLAGYGGNGNGSSQSLPTAEEEFHIYGLTWTEKELVFYVDSMDNVTHRYAPVVKNEENWPFDKPQFFILNVAVGGNWGGAQGIDNSIFPQSMEMDYVRVFQPEK